MGRHTDEAHVNGDEQDNGFGEEDTHRPADVLDDQLLKVNLDFFLLGMYAPVLCSSSELARLVDEHYWWIRLLQKEEQQRKRYESHEA